MDKVTAALYQQHPERYILVPGHEEGAPTCSYGNVQQWVGYDKAEQKFIRFTKSVFKQLVQQKEMNQNRSMNIARIVVASLYGILSITGLVNNQGTQLLSEKGTVTQHIHCTDSTGVVHLHTAAIK